MKFRKILSLLFIILTPIALCAQGAPEISFIKVHADVLSEYTKAKSSLKLYDHIALQDLFKKASDVDSKYLKKLEKDISKLRKIISLQKKKKNNVEQESRSLQSLEHLFSFLKKYRLQMDVVSFHVTVKKDWGDLMQAVDEGEDILPMLASKGIPKEGVRALKIFINKINQILRKAEEYETRLHSDWIDLKLINYVLKIELIRLRNAAIFHPTYRGIPTVTAYPR